VTSLTRFISVVDVNHEEFLLNVTRIVMICIIPQEKHGNNHVYRVVAQTIDADAKMDIRIMESEYNRLRAQLTSL
jgi:hypothetical protein